VDALDLNSILDTRLEEFRMSLLHGKGKQREGSETDADLALQMQMRELEAQYTITRDSEMARSMASAILQDSALIQSLFLQEDQARRDHNFAFALDGRDDSPDLPATHNLLPEVEDPWQDPEIIAKAAALFMYSPTDERGLYGDLFEDDDSAGMNESSEAVPESSKMAARRSPLKRSTHICVACQAEHTFHDVARVPCGHEYCRACIADLFELALKDEAFFPPRCDGKEIPLARVRLFLPSHLAKSFENGYMELSTKDRTYCYKQSCSVFIPSTHILDGQGTCPNCNKTTCTICKSRSHTGDCPADQALQQLINTATTEQWQRCFECKRFVELLRGCNHIT
jgi:hypothetical protein